MLHKKTLKTLLHGCLLWGLLTPIGFAQVSGENQLKAAFLFNFARLIDWPEDAFIDNTFNLCTLENSDINSFLMKYQGKNAKGKKLQVSVLENLKNTQSCNLLYLEKSHVFSVESDPIWRHFGTLAVSDAPGFVECSGHIELAVDKERSNKLKLRINKLNTDADGFRISSRILIRSEVLDSKTCP